MQTEPNMTEKLNIIATEPIITDTKTNVMGYIPNSVNVLSLAYLGDAVWEIFVRERVIRSLPNANHADVLHKKGIHYVNASSQARVIKKLINDGILTEEEVALVKRARNHRTATKAKNADAITYKWATAFESLLGFLYLSKENSISLDPTETSSVSVDPARTNSVSTDTTETNSVSTDTTETNSRLAEIMERAAQMLESPPERLKARPNA